eukprot:g58113.t1
MIFSMYDISPVRKSFLFWIIAEAVARQVVCQVSMNIFTSRVSSFYFLVCTLSRKTLKFRLPLPKTGRLTKQTSWNETKLRPLAM